MESSPALKRTEAQHRSVLTDSRLRRDRPSRIRTAKFRIFCSMRQVCAELRFSNECHQTGYTSGTYHGPLAMVGRFT